MELSLHLKNLCIDFRILSYEEKKNEMTICAYKFLFQLNLDDESRKKRLFAELRDEKYHFRDAGKVDEISYSLHESQSLAALLT